MVGVERFDDTPQSVIVVGAGIVGLSTAFFLQERGLDVTVVDRIGVAAGAGCASAGWVAPGLTVPLNSPAQLRCGLGALHDSTSPLHIPLTADPGLAIFMIQFAANCRRSSWRRVIRANSPLNEECIEAFDVLVANGVDVPVTDTPITAVFRTTEEAERMLAELRELEKAGQKQYFTALAGEALREQVPLASSAITAAVNINGQRFVDPQRFVEALGRTLIERGAVIRRLEITDVRSSTNAVTVYPRSGKPLTADAAVIATGARLSDLAGRWLRVRVRAGRGYSFAVPADRPIPSPIYLPGVRLTCTPYRGAIRVAGAMELRKPDDPVIPERVEAIVASARPLLDGIRWDERTNVRVGSRPITADGRPLVGEVTRGVYLAGGHGMWGFAHGPVTGRLLAEQITTGKQPEALLEFDPLRKTGR